MYALRTYVFNRPVASFWGLKLSFLFPTEPVIQFTKERVFVAGPVVRNAHVEARITVKKTGDPFTRSKVRVYTLDGSAKAGKGYQAMTQVRTKNIFRTQEPITWSEQLPCTRVTAFSRTSLFLERFWPEFRISLKSHKPVGNT